MMATLSAFVDLFHQYYDTLRMPIVAACAATICFFVSYLGEGNDAWGRFCRLCTALCLVAGCAFSIANFATFADNELRKYPTFWHSVLLGNEADHEWAMTVVQYVVAKRWQNIVAILSPCGGLALILIICWLPLVKLPVDYLMVQFSIYKLRQREGWLKPGFVASLARSSDGIPIGRFPYWIFPTGLFPFGLFPFGRLLRYVPQDRVFLAGHHMVIAGTRAGKGVAAVIPAILDHNGPIVVLDIKGENMAMCRRHRASLKREQIVLNPFGLVDDKTQFFNPMDYLRTGPTLQRDIAVLADGLITPVEGEGEWIGKAARELVEAALELIATMGRPEDKSVKAISDLLLMGDRDKTLTAWRKDKDACNGRLSKAATTILDMSDKSRGNVLSHVSECLSWIKLEQMQALTNPRADGSFQFAKLLNGKQDVYIVIPQDMTQALGGFMRVVMNTILGAVTRLDGKRKIPQKILCVFDEFTRLGRMEKIMEIATIAAGGGVEAVFVVQDLGTLQTTYGDESSRTLLGSCATTRIFGLGSGDDMTAKWAESLMPKRPIYRQSRRAKETTLNENEAPLLSGPELLQMPATLMLCRFRSMPPLLVSQIISHKDSAYRRKIDENPVRRA